jgi:hypothetical protein
MRILSLITILSLTNLTACSVLDLGDKVIKPKVNEDNYWKTPCIWDGAILKKPYNKEETKNNDSH